MGAATNNIANLVVGIGADPTELKRGLGEGAQAVEKFAQGVSITAKQMSAALERTGGDLQKATRLAVQMAEAEMRKVAPISSAPGFKPPSGADFSIGVRRISEARTRMLQEAVRRSDEQLATQISRNDVFVTGFQKLGLHSGQVLARAMSQGFAQGNAAGNIRRALTGGSSGGNILGGLGSGIGAGRATNAFIAGAFTLASLGDAFGTGETKLTRFTNGLNQVLRTGSVIAAFYGPNGLVVSAILAGTSFMLDFWARQRDEIAKLQKDTQQRIDDLVNTRDTSRQLLRLQELDVGQASAGTSPFAANSFSGGINDLQSQISKQEALLQRSNVAQALLLKRSLDNLRERLAPLLAEKAQLMAAIMNPTTVPEIRGMPGINVTAPAPGHEFDDLLKSAARIAGFYRTLAGAQAPLLETTHKFARVYLQLGDAIGKIKNPWSDQAIALRAARAEMEKIIPLLAIIQGNAPLELGQTSILGSSTILHRSIPRGIIPGPTPRDQLPGGGPGFLTNALGPAIAGMVRTIGSTIGGVLNSTLVAAMGPVALLFRALEPALNILNPLLDKIVAPIAAVLQVIVAGLEPALRLLFPVIKLAAIVLSFFAEITQRITAIIARAFGNLIIAIGKIIRGLSFGLAGKGIENLGNSILAFADSTKKSADEMEAVRKKLYGMNFGDTADAISGLGDAARQTATDLLNVPYWWKVALAQFNAAAPGGRVPGGGGAGGGAGGGGTGLTPGGPTTPLSIQFHGDVTIQTEAKSADQVFIDVARIAREKSVQRTGTTANAGAMLAYAR